MNYSSLYPPKCTINWYIVFFTIAFLRSVSAFYEILTSDWLDDVIKSAALYVTIKYRKVNIIEIYTNK